MGPSTTIAPDGTIAGYGNPFNTASAAPTGAQQGIMDAVGYSGQNLSNSDVVGNPNAGGQVQGASTVVDPNAAAAAATAAANAQKSQAFQLEDQGALNTAGSSGDAAAAAYKSNILDYLSGAQQQQNTINNEAVQAELAKRQGSQGVLDYVHNGIQSGGVLLGNKNAGTSSATEALARAYSTLGAHQLAGVGTQYAGDENKVNLDQTNLGIANDTQSRHNQEYEASTVSGIVNAANTAITNIRANMAYASLPDQIDQQAQIAQIQQAAQAKLSAVSPTYGQGIAAINPSSQADRAGAAQNLANAGTAATNPYQLTTQAPAAFADGGQPAGADLPIFTLPKSKTNG